MRLLVCGPGQRRVGEMLREAQQYPAHVARADIWPAAPEDSAGDLSYRPEAATRDRAADQYRPQQEVEQRRVGAGRRRRQRRAHAAPPIGHRAHPTNPEYVEKREIITSAPVWGAWTNRSPPR